MADRSFGTSKQPGDPADFDSERDSEIPIPRWIHTNLVNVLRLSEERIELKDALYAKEKELSEAIYKLKPGAKK